LRQLPLIGVEGEEFSGFAFESRGDVKDIERPIATLQGMCRRESAGTGEDIGQVAGKYDNSTDIAICVKVSLKLIYFCAREEFAPTCQTKRILQFEFI